ncbi:MAG: hypothetical protein ABI954_01105 [Pyrinomonadaceae bacterium]
MKTTQNLKIIELRNYLLKPDARDGFIDYFKNHFIDSQNKLGGYVLGEFTIKGDDDRFFWIRGFEDMTSRSAFLPQFYGGEVWKEFGPGANEMLLEWHNVHLLKPLNNFENERQKNEVINTHEFAKLKGIVVVEHYTAYENELDKLIDFFQTDYLPFLRSLKIQNITLWISEAVKNDFPRLPVIQDKNMLVAIATFADETDYQAKLKLADSLGIELKSQMEKLITGKNSLILYPTENSTNVNYEKI